MRTDTGRFRGSGVPEFRRDSEDEELRHLQRKPPSYALKPNAARLEDKLASLCKITQADGSVEWECCGKRYSAEVDALDARAEWVRSEEKKRNSAKKRKSRKREGTTSERST